MIFDSRQQVSFVQADIEIGQKFRGLYQSSQKFLHYFAEHKYQFKFDLEIMGQVSELMGSQNYKFHSEQDFQKFPALSYKYLSELCYLGLLKNNLCLNFGGDHSIALSTINASLKYDPNTLVIWVDAHPDINDAQHSFTGNFHGMPVHYLIEQNKRHQSFNWMSEKLDTNNLIYLGLRDIDAYEQQYLIDQKIQFYTSDMIRDQGLKHILASLLPKINQHDHIHLSFDIDSMDPDLNLCTGVPVAGGLSIQQVSLIAEFIQKTRKLKTIDIVEINPDLAQHSSDLADVFDIVQHFLNKLISPISVNLTKDKQIEDQGDFNDRFF